MPFDALKQSLGTETFCELLLSVCEAYFSANSDIKDFAFEMVLFKIIRNTQMHDSHYWNHFNPR